jgi:hypothetical protein
VESLAAYRSGRGNATTQGDRSMSVQPAPAGAATRRRSLASRRRLLDRVFLGGCTATYVILIGAVIAALRFYGG